MSRYEELVEAASDLEQRRKEFQERSYEIVKVLRNSIHEYLDCPDSGVRLFRPSEGFDHTKLVGPAAAEMGDDGLWRIVVLRP